MGKNIGFLMSSELHRLQPCRKLTCLLLKFSIASQRIFRSLFPTKRDLELTTTQIGMRHELAS